MFRCKIYRKIQLFIKKIDGGIIFPSILFLLVNITISFIILSHMPGFQLIILYIDFFLHHIILLKDNTTTYICQLYLSIHLLKTKNTVNSCITVNRVLLTL